MPSSSDGAAGPPGARVSARARRHPRWPLAATLVALLVLGGACVEDDPAPAVASDPGAGTDPPGPHAADTAAPGRPPRPWGRDGPPREPAGRRALVARVVDGDTVELGDGRVVRLVGIDTPERGGCGFDRASDALARLAEGRRVRLTRPVGGRDRYGRLLRYLDVGGVDPGLRLIRRGLAVARYDSRDGYAFHPRQPAYVAADRVRGPVGCAAPVPSPTAEAAPPRSASGGCASGYAPCIPAYPPDLDCRDLPGPVRVRDADPHRLDADGDGRACES